MDSDLTKKISDENRALLELAKIPSGLRIEGWTLKSAKGMRLAGLDHEFVRYWNPLDNNEDSKQLAEKLSRKELLEAHLAQPSEQTRYAIVVEAAEAGSTTKN